MKEITTSAFRVSLAKLIDASRHIIVTCHKKPDGDAIGSSVGMCCVLRSMGKDCAVVTPDAVPYSLTFVTEPVKDDAMLFNSSTARNRLLNADLILCMDYGDLKRTGGYMCSFLQRCKAPRVMIDHHMEPQTDSFTLALSHPELSSASEVAYRMVCEMGWGSHVDIDAASSFFVGMMTDTGNLAYSSSYPEVYEIMGELVGKGINKELLYKQAMDTVSLNSLRLQSFALLERTTYYDSGRVALVTLSKDDLARYHYVTGDTERLVNRPMSVKEVYWSVFMREDADCIKVSMRSEGAFTVNELCSRYLGGGGHAHAAAGEFKGELKDAVELFHKILDDIGIGSEPAQIDDK